MTAADRTARVLGGLGVAFALAVGGCIPIPVGSRVTTDDGLPDALQIAAGESVTVCGENGSAPRGSAIGPYFTGGCQCVFRPNLVGETARLLLELNPAPGAYAVRPLDELAPDAAAGGAQDKPEVRLFGISGAKAAALRVRYVVHVQENIDRHVYVPLYIIPFGVAVCGFETTLEAQIYETSSGRLVGAATVKADGTFVLVAYMLGVLFYSDTQDGARRQFAELIVSKLTRDRP